MAGATLVASRHDTNCALVHEGVVNRQVMDARDAEDGVNPMSFQCFDEQLCAGPHRFPLRSIGARDIGRAEALQQKRLRPSG